MRNLVPWFHIQTFWHGRSFSHFSYIMDISFVNGVQGIFVPTSKCEHSGIPAIFRRDTKKLRLEIKERLAMVWLLCAKRTEKVSKNPHFQLFSLILWIKQYPTKVMGRLRCHYSDSNENVRKAVGLDKQIKQLLNTCTKRFCTFLCRQCTTMTWTAKFHVSSTTWTYDDKFLFLSLILNFFLKNSTPWQFAYIGQSERVGIIALKFQRTRSHF